MPNEDEMDQHDEGYAVVCEWRADSERGSESCMHDATGQYNIDGEVEWRCGAHVPDDAIAMPGTAGYEGD